jgi:hypothetical protein
MPNKEKRMTDNETHVPGAEAADAETPFKPNPYGEWVVGVGIRVVTVDGDVKSWSDEHTAVGTEEMAQSRVVSRMRATVVRTYPGAQQIEITVLASRLDIDYFRPGFAVD